MDDLKAVFRDEPIAPERESAVTQLWDKVYDLLPKKRDPNARPSALDTPQGWQAAIRNLFGTFFFDGEKTVGTIASGDRFAPRDLEDGSTEYAVTWTCKAVTLFLIALMGVISVQSDTRLGFTSVGGGILAFIKGFGPILGYIVAYQWLFKVRLSGDELTVMNYFFQTKRYKLDDILHVSAHPRSHIYKVHFENGSKAHVFKFINGHSELIEELESIARR